MFISVMEGSLPKSLKHIISNAEYYGPSLFLLGKCFHYIVCYITYRGSLICIFLKNDLNLHLMNHILTYLCCSLMYKVGNFILKN